MTQLDIFINAIRGCKNPRCEGELVNSHVRSNGLGGAIVVTLHAMAVESAFYFKLLPRMKE